MPEVVYRSTDPVVIAHWDAVVEAKREWPKRAEQMLAELGMPGATLLRKGRFPVGVRHGVREDVPDGWRRDSRDRAMIAPARRTKAGKEIGKKLNALRLPDVMVKMPGGMPTVALNGARTHFITTRRIHKAGDAVCVVWPESLDKGDASHIDTDVWERVKLSEYYAVLEAEEAKAS